jgi:hypothetical protein
VLESVPLAGGESHCNTESMLFGITSKYIDTMQNVKQPCSCGNDDRSRSTTNEDGKPNTATMIEKCCH